MRGRTGEVRRPVGEEAGGGLCGESADRKSEGIAESGNLNKSPNQTPHSDPDGIPISTAAQSYVV